MTIVDVPYALSPGGDSLIFGHAATPELSEGIYLLDLAAVSPPTFVMQFDSPDRNDPDPFSFRFAPDGSKIAYVSARGGGRDLWVRDLTTKVEKQVTSTYGNCEAGDWDPSGRYLVYSRPLLPFGAPDTSAGLFFVDTETLSERPLVNAGKATFGASPRWSADSSRIAFWRGTAVAQRPPNTVLHVFSIRPDGTNLVDLTPSYLENCESPVWIEGGARILFEVFDRSTFAIHNTRVIQNDGGGDLLWVLDLNLPRSTASSDGMFFAYTAPDSSGQYGVVFRQETDDVDGTSRVQVTRPPTSASTTSSQTSLWPVLEDLR